MASELRPLTPVQVLDAAWLALRRNWVQIYACSGAGSAPLALGLMLYFLWLGRLVEGTEDRVYYAGTLIWAAAMACAWGLNSVARGAVTALVLADARGEPPLPGPAWQLAGRRGVGGLFVGLSTFAAASLGGTCLVPGLLLALAWWVARPALLAEEHTLTGALRRSWKLTEGSRARALALWLLFVSLGGITALNLHLLVHALAGTVSGLLGIDASGLQPYLTPGNQAYVTFLLAVTFVLLDPLKTAADALLYLDLRVRREGADLQERLRGLRTGGLAAGILLLIASAAPAAAMTAEEYAARLRALRQRIEAPGSPAIDPADAAPLRHQVVRMPGGAAITVENGWIGAGLRGLDSPEDRQALAQRLRALELSLGGSAGGPGPEAAAPPPVDTDAALARILAEPEFQPLADRPELRELARRIDLSKPGNWWSGFWDWVRRTFFTPRTPRIEPPASSPRFPPMGFLRWVVIALIAAVVLFLLALLVRWFLERPARAENGAPEPAAAPIEASATENALDHTVDEWERFARMWLGRGEIKQAVRALYLAMLVHLHRERLIDYNRAFTNWAYVRQFRGDAEQRGVLGQLTGTFDEVWYGDRECGEEQYRRFEAGVRRLGTPAPA